MSIIKYSFYALFFLVPLILTPLNFELFEFNKMLMVYALTTIIVCAWLVKMVLQKRFIFHPSFWDIPLLIFLISQFLSFAFSVDRHTSFWGYYSRFNGGLLSIVCYAILYWAFVSNMNFSHLRGVFACLLSSATLVAGYGIAEHFGIDAKYWVQDVRNRVFSTLGQPNWLAAWLAALAPLTWALALNSKLKMPAKRDSFGMKNFKFYIYYLLFTIYYLCLLYTRSRSGLLGFTVAYFVFWPLAFWLHRRDWKTILRPFLIFNFSFLILTFITGSWIPGVEKISRFFRPQPTTESTIELTTESTTNQPLLISESGDIRKVVWQGAVEIWRHYPILGTGPETFAYSYYWYRPREHNDLSEWDFLYNKAHNEYLNLAATTGTVGLVTYLILIASFVFWSLSKFFNFQFSIPQESHTVGIFNLSLLAGFASIVATNFFGFSVVPVNLLFYLFPAFAEASAGKPAMSAVLARREEPKEKRAKTQSVIRNSQFAIVILIILLAGYGLRVILNYWLADARFASGEKLNKAGQYDLAFNSLRQAVELRSAEPVYHDELGLAAANLAVFADSQKNATLAAQLIEIALDESNKAVKTSPYHLNFWKNRTKIFYKLAEIKPEYYQQALASLLRAAELAPTDAKIFYNLGLMYAQVDQEETAIKTLEKTIELKPNYGDARYALALFYEQKGDLKKARHQLEYILEKINPNREAAKEKLEKL